MHNFIIIALLFFALCSLLVYCLCAASTNWRDGEHDYELDDFDK